MIDLIEMENFGHTFTSQYIKFNGVNKEELVTRCLVLRVDELTVGYILFNHYDENTEILMMGVWHKFMRIGIGTDLINMVKNISNTITLEVRKSNERAIGFYERNGFVLFKQMEKYYEDEDGFYYLWKKN